MVVKLDDLSDQLEVFDKLTMDEMRALYRRSLLLTAEQLDTSRNSKRIRVARVFVVAHGFAARYFARFGEPIDAEAFPGDRWQGDGPALRTKGADNSLQLANLEDELFEFVAALRPDYREEFLSLLKEGWIGKVIEP